MSITVKSLGVGGRLGNQLFQIMNVLELSEKYKLRAIFPKWLYNKYFKKQITEYTNTDEKINWRPYFYWSAGFKQIELNTYNNWDMNGYFLSYKYFDKEKTLEQFKLKEEYTKYILDKYGKYFKNSIGIHVRRTDYLQLNMFLNDWETYYNEAIKIIKNKKEIENIIICSDDIEWCKENLQKVIDKIYNDKKINCVYVEKEEDIIDLYILSYCENIVISNSTFSWWSGYFNKNKESIITIPKTWNPPFLCDIEKQDLKLENWVVI